MTKSEVSESIFILLIVIVLICWAALFMVKCTTTTVNKIETTINKLELQGEK